MKIQSLLFLFESYKTALEVFSRDADPNEVKQYFEKFKQLGNKNLINKDISFWIPKGWDNFKKEIDNNLQYNNKSKTQIKRKKVVGESVTIHEDDNWLVVIPLDKDASCFHGRDTDWCTTKPTQNHFETYFYDNEITLIYCISKKDAGRYAIAFYYEMPDELELFNKEDDKITSNQFRGATGFTPQKLVELASSHSDKTDASRTEYKEAVEELKDVDFNSLGQRNKRIEWLLRKTKDINMLTRYLKKFNDQVPVDLQLAAVQKNGYSIAYIKNPSEQVQLAAVKENPRSIEYIKNPSEQVQLAAVKEDGYSIKYIKNPSEQVQLAAVKESGYSIKYIKNPSEEVQLAAVKEDGYSIKYIMDKVIPPSEQVQLAAVKEDGYSIKYIKNPSEQVQLAAVQKNGASIGYIDNPSPTVQKAAGINT